MSHGKIRHQKDCLNCGHYVEEKFCPNCGQENSEPRKPFHYLFTHFFEDLTHYDGQFWGTIKNLLFKPGKLTNTYLEGKRQMFVPPVKLYIFVSFVTFLLLAFNTSKATSEETNQAEINQVNKRIILNSEKKADLLKRLNTSGNLSKDDSIKILKGIIKSDSIDIVLKNVKMMVDPEISIEQGESAMSIDRAVSIEEFDKLNIEKNHRYDILRPFVAKFYELQEKGMSPSKIIDAFVVNLVHNLPKALFLYLPIFAMLLWLFHSKKKWWYFDHGIFTLHYFAFLLLVVFILSVINSLFSLIGDFTVLDIISNLFMVATIIYVIYYFFRAHYKIYRIHPALTIFTGIVLFLINTLLFGFLLLGLGVYSFLYLH